MVSLKTNIELVKKKMYFLHHNYIIQALFCLFFLDDMPQKCKPTNTLFNVIKYCNAFRKF